MVGPPLMNASLMKISYYWLLDSNYLDNFSEICYYGHANLEDLMSFRGRKAEHEKRTIERSTRRPSRPGGRLTRSSDAALPTHQASRRSLVLGLAVRPVRPSACANSLGALNSLGFRGSMSCPSAPLPTLAV